MENEKYFKICWLDSNHNVVKGTIQETNDRGDILISKEQCEKAGYLFSSKKTKS